MDKKYLLVMPDGKSRAYSAEEFASPNIQKWLENTPSDKFSVFEQSPINDDDGEQENDVYNIRLVNGNTVKERRYSPADWQSDNVQNWVKEHPEVEVSRIRPYDYWGEKTKSQQDAIDAFDNANRGFMDEFEARQLELDDSVSSIEAKRKAAAFVTANSQRYQQLVSERDTLQAEYDSNPAVLAAKRSYTNQTIADIQRESQENSRRWDELARQDMEVQYNPDDKADRRRPWLNRLAQLSNPAPALTADKYARRRLWLNRLALGTNPAAASMAEQPGAMNVTSQLTGNADAEANYKAANQLNDESIKMYGAKEKGDFEGLTASEKIAAGAANYGKAIKDRVTDQEFWESLTDPFGNSRAMLNLHNKVTGLVGSYKDINEADMVKLLDEQLTDSEQALLTAYLRNAQAQQDNPDIHWTYKAGSTTADSMKFMAEFMLGSGVTQKVMTGATRGMLKWFAKKAATATTKAGRALTRGAGKLAVGEVRALVGGTIQTAMAPSTYANVTKRMTEIDQETGQLSGMGEAILDGIIDSYIENASEFGLGLTNKALTAGKKGLSRAIGHTRWGQFYSPKMGGFMKQAGVGSFIEEWGEEVNGAYMRSILGNISGGRYGDTREWSNFWTLENQLTLAASFAPTIGGGKVIDIAQEKVATRQQEKARNRVLEMLSSRGYDEQTARHFVDAIQGDTPYDLIHNASPFLMHFFERNKDDEAAIETVLDYIQRTARVLEYGALRENNIRLQRQQQLDSVNDKMQGARFWIDMPLPESPFADEARTPDWIDDLESEDSQAVGNEVVRKLTDADSRDGYIVGGSKDGWAVNWQDGSKSILSDTQIDELVKDGRMYDTGFLMFNDYLDMESTGQTEQAEQMRMATEREAQLNDIKNRLQPGTVFDIDTPQGKGKGEIIQATADGVVVDIDGTMTQYSWEEAAQMIGSPIVVKTDDENASDAADNIEHQEELRRMVDEAGRGGATITRGGERVSIMAALGWQTDDTGNQVLHVYTTDSQGVATDAWLTPDEVAEVLAQETARTVVSGAEQNAEMSADERAARQCIDEWVKRTGVNVNIYTSVEQVQDRKAAEAIAAGRPLTGWYNPKTDTVEFYMPNILMVADPAKEAEKTFLHEVIAHAGLRRLLDPDVEGQTNSHENFNRLMDRVWADLMTDEDKARYLEYNRHRTFATEKAAQRAAADEFVARLAESMNTAPTAENEALWDRFVQIIMDILSALHLTKDELSEVLRASLANLERTARQEQQDSDTGQKSALEQVPEIKDKNGEVIDYDWVKAPDIQTALAAMKEAGYDDDVIRGYADDMVKTLKAKARQLSNPKASETMAQRQRNKTLLAENERQTLFWQTILDSINSAEQAQEAAIQQGESGSQVAALSPAEESRAIYEELGIDTVTARQTVNNSDYKFEGGLNLSALPSSTANVDSHGIVKGRELEFLLNLLRNGIDRNRRFDTAPLGRPYAANGVGAGLGTASGTSYRDGLFIIASANGEMLVDSNGNLHVATVLINDMSFEGGNPLGTQTAKALQAKLASLFPGIDFILYSEANEYYSNTTIGATQQSGEGATAPVKDSSRQDSKEPTAKKEKKAPKRLSRKAPTDFQKLRKAVDDIIDEMDFATQVRYAVSRYKFLWGDLPGSKGLAHSVIATKGGASEKDRRQYFGWTAGKEKGDKTPEQIAEAIMAELPEAITEGHDTSETLDIVLDAVTSAKSPSALVRQVYADIVSRQEQAEREEDERRQDAFAKAQGFDSYEEYAIFESGEDIIEIAPEQEEDYYNTIYGREAEGNTVNGIQTVVQPAAGQDEAARGGNTLGQGEETTERVVGIRPEGTEASSDDVLPGTAQGAGEVGIIQGLEDYTEQEIQEIVGEYMEDTLGGSVPDNFRVTGIRIIGSRANGTAREDSDLDVLVEYEGDISEDSLFNALNGEDGLEIDGIKVDINPITPGKSGTIDEWLERNADYREDKQDNPVDNNGLEKIKRQAEREDGQLLILPSGYPEEVGALSDPTQGLSSESKDTQSSESANEIGENNELTDAQVKALAFVTGKSEEEIRAQQGGLPYDASGEKTLHHPATLRAAYESGNAADIARAEKAVGDYIMSSNSIERLDSTAKDFAARKKQAEKGSAEYRMDDFCEKKCRERIKEIKREAAEVKEPTERIDDVGEKIGGARKDLAQKMSDKIDLDADNFPKMFPKFDLKKMVEQGLDPKLAAPVQFLRQAAYEEYKRYTKRYGKKYALKAAQFYAAYAKRLLETGNADVDFKDSGFAFTEYGQAYIKTNIALFEKIYEALGDDMFGLDLKDYYIIPLTAGSRANSKYYRRGENGEMEQVDAYYATSHVGGGTSYYEEGRLGDAIDEVVGRLTKSVDYKKSHPYKLVHYYRPGVRNSDYVGVKLGGKVVPLTDTMSSAEVQRYMRDHEAELQEKARMLDEQRKQKGEKSGGEGRWKPELTLGGKRTRVGKDFRGGRNVSPEEFRSTFGFRGVEFGNYVTQQERQRFLNESYDALMDLADMLGVSPRALGLGGQLGFAIGARGGGGQAAAHYEPGRNVINLTKTQGAGSLAHEWWHALDYFLNRDSEGRRKKSATANRRQEDFNTDAASTDTINAFLSLMRAIEDSEYMERSKQLEEKVHPNRIGEGYYDKPTELAARAFQDYVQRRLTDSGQINDFLSSFTPEDRWNGEPDTYPFPQGEEATRLGSVFDSMFATMQEREEDGNVVLFRMADEQAEQARLDKEYVEAVKSGDIDKALDMLRKKALTTEGITGFVAPNAYSGSHRDVAKLIKTGKSDAVQKAAADMARFVPGNAVLVPIPSHEGKVTDETDTKILADAVAEITGSPVVVALEGNPRESRYQAKQQGKEGLKADELGFRQIAEIPEGKIPVFIDNVVDSGETAKAASEAIKGGFTMAYAKGVRSNPTSGLKNMTVTYDDNGNLIPLSQRFDADNTDIRFREANDKNKQPDMPEPDLDAADTVLFRVSNRDRETISRWLSKRTDLTEPERQKMLDYLDTLDDKKMQLAAGWWFAKGTIRLPEDMPKVEQAVQVAGIAKVDPLRYDSPMELINAHADIQIKEKPINPDEVKTLHKAKELPGGIVVYDVDDTEESRENMRRIINTHFGKEASPWCLLQGDGKGNLTEESRKYWKHYNSYPKQVAFKNGKLVAFSANDRKKRVWWDRMDQSLDGIPYGEQTLNYGYKQKTMMTPDGTEKGYGAKYRGNTQNGTYEELWPNGNIKERVTFKNGYLDGLYELFYQDGKPMVKSNYIDGKEQGWGRHWFNNGRLAARTLYKNGMLVFSEGWDEDGNYVHMSQSNDEKYENGTWYDNGQMESRFTGELRDGELYGIREDWNRRGRMTHRERVMGRRVTEILPVTRDKGMPAPDKFNEEEEQGVRFRVVAEPLAIASLEAGKKQSGFRTVALNEDATFGSPMAGRLGRTGGGSVETSRFELGKWEQAEENPEMATEGGKVNLIKPNGRGSVGGVDYNPYIHIRPTSVNRQFTQAWARPELVYIETEYPESELTSGYKADKAKLPVGRHPWNGGELILSRYDKPKRIVPWEEVADEWEKEFKGSGVTFDIVAPELLPILSERGVEILPPKKAAGKAAMDAYKKWLGERGLEGGDEIHMRIANEALKVLDAYENGEGFGSYLSLVDGIENSDVLMEDKTLSSLIGEYRSLQEVDRMEGRRDYTGGEMDDLVEDEIIPRLRSLADDDIRFRESGEQLGLFSPEEMNGDVAGSQKNINFAPNGKSNERTESDIQRQGDRSARQNDRAGADGVRRKGDVFGSTLAGRRADSLIPPLRKLEEGEMCLVERKMTEDRNFSFIGGNKIETLDDIAYIFKSLETKSIENAFLVFTGGKTKGAVVLHVGMGGIAGSSADLSPVLPMIEAERPSHVVLVHNHPSGNLVASRQDVGLLQALEQRVKTFAPYVTVDPGIIIDTTKGVYGVFDAGMNAVGAMPDKARGKEIRVPVFKFDEQAFSADYNPLHLEQIRTSRDIAQFAATHRLGERRKVNIICLNSNGQVVGNFFSDLKDVSTEDEARRLARECAHYANICGSANVCVYGTGIPAKGSFLRSTMSYLNKADIRLLDVLHIDENYNYDSYADRGMMEPEMQYGGKLTPDELSDKKPDESKEDFFKRADKAFKTMFTPLCRMKYADENISIEEFSLLTGITGDRLAVSHARFLRPNINAYHYAMQDLILVKVSERRRNMHDVLETMIHENIHSFILHKAYKNGIFGKENELPIYISRLNTLARKIANVIRNDETLNTVYADALYNANDFEGEILPWVLSQAIINEDVSWLYDRLDEREIEIINDLFTELGYENDVFRGTEGGGSSEENGASYETGAGTPSGRRTPGNGRLSAGTEGRDIQGGIEDNTFGYAEKEDTGRESGYNSGNGQGGGRLLGRGWPEQGGAAEEEVGGQEGADDSPTLFRESEPGDYLGSAADLTNRCRAVGANLGVPVEVINEPLNATVSTFEGGTLTINIGALNGQSELSAALMAMSEKMSLSEILGDEAVREFAQECYRELPEFRQKVVEIAQERFGWNTAKAMMQYLGSMAESEVYDDESALAWYKIREAFDNMLYDRVFADMTPMGAQNIASNELRYILFNNAHHGDNSIGTIARGARLAHAQGVSAADDEIRADGAQAARVQQAQERTGESAANLYNRVVSRMWSRMDETYRDQFQSVNTLVDALEKASGKKAQGFEDIRKALNQQSSKGLAAMQKWHREHFVKMMKAVDAIIDERGLSYDEVERYLMLKHGVERNDVFAKRDARAYYQAIHDSKVASIREYARQHPEVAGEEMQRRIDREDEILDRRFTAIESGTDGKYKKLREKDYGGLTGLYSKYEDIEPYDPTKETQEGYEKRLLAARKPMFDNLADMEQAADAEIADFEERMGPALTTELWKQINGATKAVLKHQYDANMMSRGQYEHVRDMFDYYVPLRGFAETTPEDMYSYYTSNADAAFVAPLKQAKGRKTRAEGPLKYIGAMADSAIAADIKNESKLALYYFVSNRQANNDLVMVSDVWYVKQVDADGNALLDEQGRTIFEPQYPPFTEALSTEAAKQEYERWENEMKQLAREHRAFRGVREIEKQRLNYVVNTTKQQAKSHVIAFKLGGRDMFMFINGNPRAAQAINGELNVDASKNEFTKVTLKFLRGFASLNTSLNPEFWLSNMQRDVLFALMSVSVKEDKAYNEAFRRSLKEAFKVVRMKRDLQNGTLGNSELEQHYRMFVENGGVTGYTSVRGTDVWEAEIKKYTGDTRTAIERVGSALDAVQEFGESFEQMTRFAAYLTSRRQGKSVVDSVADAKELTVNFNRKGSGKGITWKESEFLRTRKGRKLNDMERLFAVSASMLSVYGRHAIMFFNASVQGLNAMYQLAKKDKGKLGLWVGGYLMLGAMNAVLHAMLDGDGDDDDQYLDVPDYERRNNLLLGLKGVYLKWALPQEARVFYGMGDMIVNHSLGREPHRNIVGEAASMIGEIAPLDATSGLAAVTPSITTPIVEVIQNEDYKGARVYNDNRFLSDEEKKHIPAYRNPLKNTSKVYLALSEALNWASGGNEYEAGAVNWNPNIMEHIVEGYTGGVGTTVGKGLKFMENALGGEVKISDTPFLRRLMTWNDDRYRNAHVTDLYYYYREVAQNTERLIKEAAKAGDEKQYKKVAGSYDYKVLEVWRRYEGEMDAYDKYLRLIDAKDRKRRKQVTREHDALRSRMIKEISDLK